MTKKIVGFTYFYTPSTLAANHALIDAAPLDGCIMGLDFTHPTAGPGALFQTYNFSNYAVSWESLLPNVESMNSFSFTNAYHNFPALNVRPGNQDWFDADWIAAIVENFRIAAKFCSACNLPGFLFDAEPYNGPVWDPQAVPSYPEHTVAEHRIAAYDLGNRAGQVIHAEKNDIKVFLTIPNLGFLGDPSVDLYGYFLNGLVDALSPREGTYWQSMISGEENTYSALDDDDYLYYDNGLYTALIGHPELSENYMPQQSKAFSVSPQGGGETWDHNNFNNNYQTPAVFQQLANTSLALSGEYAWIYSRGIYWYSIGALNNVFDPEYVTALQNARTANQMRVW